MQPKGMCKTKQDLELCAMKGYDSTLRNLLRSYCLEKKYDQKMYEALGKVSPDTAYKFLESTLPGDLKIKDINLDEYHIDHVEPIARSNSFEETVNRWRITNMALIPAKENMAKKDKDDSGNLRYSGILGKSLMVSTVLDEINTLEVQGIIVPGINRKTLTHIIDRRFKSKGLSIPVNTVYATVKQFIDGKSNK